MDKVSLLSADTYIVVNRTILTLEDRDNLITLYEPIMGCTAVSLYLTLWHDLDYNAYKSKEYSHSHLINFMRLDLKSIKVARQALESLGLIKTFYNKENNSYIYELYSPLSSKEFLNHPVLNISLFNNIGKEEYDVIKKKNVRKSVPLDNYEDITSTLNMTFTSTNGLDEVDAASHTKLNVISSNVIDFDMLISSIPEDILNEKALNKKTRELIENLAFVYNLSTMEFSEIIKTCLNERGYIVQDELRKLARNYYTYHNNGKLPTLIYKEEDKTKILNSMSNRDKMIYIFENTKPYDFLKHKYHGITPTNRDLKLIESLIVDLKLKPSVVNVLIDYVLKKNDNKLNKNFVETIAGQWVRCGVKSAKEAMSIAEKEQKKMLATNQIKVSKPDTEPSWFKEEIKKTEATMEEQKELEELMKGIN